MKIPMMAIIKNAKHPIMIPIMAPRSKPGSAENILKVFNFCLFQIKVKPKAKILQTNN